jgi:hypothetical protein
VRVVGPTQRGVGAEGADLTSGVDR